MCVCVYIGTEAFGRVIARKCLRIGGSDTRVLHQT